VYFGQYSSTVKSIALVCREKEIGNNRVYSSLPPVPLIIAKINAKIPQFSRGRELFHEHKQGLNILNLNSAFRTHCMHSVKRP
jgi:hypothetical protein